jgi:hypothetical protein
MRYSFRVKEKCMTRKLPLFLLFFLGLFWMGSVFSVQAQKPAQKLTVLFSNNINGEIDPCPT